MFTRRNPDGFNYEVEYELNGLFAWLLRGLGFSVSMLSARVFRSSLGHFSPEFDHMALLVHLGRASLVDVGFGDFAHQLVPWLQRPAVSA